jgi:REP element-mobilizing transposase RayT
MRQLRVLQQGVWYEIYTAVNNREALFRLRVALALFGRVLDETRERFRFELTGLRLADDRLIFYIKPADGLALPGIMQWLKQTFAVRYNVLTGRTGHSWGDRYRSVILEGEPPEEAGRGEEAAVEPGAAERIRVSPRHGKMVIITEFSSLSPHAFTTPPP